MRRTRRGSRNPFWYRMFRSCDSFRPDAEPDAPVRRPQVSLVVRTVFSHPLKRREIAAIQYAKPAPQGKNAGAVESETRGALEVGR